MNLRPYQQAGAEWLASRMVAYLGDQVGLGKTRTALAAAAMVKAERVAVIAPALVVPQWFAERSALFGELAETDLRVTSYGKLLQADARAAFRDFDPDVVIIDEAHYLKHRTSQRYANVFGEDGVIRRARYVWLLSGTPVPRNAFELYAPLVALWPERLRQIGVAGPYEFRNTFCVWHMGTRGPKVTGTKNVALLQDLLKPLLLRRTTSLVAPELPAARWGTVSIGADEDDRLVLRRLLEGFPEYVDWCVALGRNELPILSSNLARARHMIGNAKAHVAGDLVARELRDNDFATRVVFAYHRSVLDILHRALAPYGVVRIDGDTDPETRRELIQKPWRVLLGQVEACGTGLDGIQFNSHEAVFVEPAWSVDTNVQALGRLARLGQRFPVQGRMLALDGTLDNAIVRQHHRELRMTEEILSW